MYVRSKKEKRGSKKATSFYRDNPQEYTYYQLVEGYRDEDGKVRQRVLAHLGRYADPEEAIAYLERRAQGRRQRAADLLYAAEKMRGKRFHRARYGRGKWLVP